MSPAVTALWRAARKLKARARRASPAPPLLLFTDPARLADPATAIARLPRGAGVVYRAFGAADAEASGRALAALARRRGVAFFVGADARLATRLKADGVHLPQRMARRTGEIDRLRRRFVVTAAAHDLPSALVAGRAGVSAVVLSAIFPSASPSAGAAIGPRHLAVIVRRAQAPVIALGGIDAAMARRLTRTGAAGLAAIAGLAPPRRD